MYYSLSPSLSLSPAAMETDSSSVYMCFPCYQEFNTLEEVLTHQMTCTAEAVAPPVATDETAVMSLPTLQTEVTNQNELPSVSVVMWLSGLPLHASFS